MKLKIVFQLLVFVLMFNKLKAQNTACIYKINFNIDQDLVVPTRVKVGNQSTTTSQFNTVQPFPQSLTDSVRSLVTRTVSKQLGANAVIVYKKNRRGNDIMSQNYGAQLGGMPRNRLRKAVLAEEKDYYVRVRIRYGTRGGAGVAIGGTQISQHRPVVIMRITAWDVERKKVFNKKVKAKDFSRLRSVQRTAMNVTVRQNEVLTPQDIYNMLVKATEEYEK